MTLECPNCRTRQPDVDTVLIRNAQQQIAGIPVFECRVCEFVFDSFGMRPFNIRVPLMFVLFEGRAARLSEIHPQRISPINPRSQ